jgi:hypothetical protein
MGEIFWAAALHAGGTTTDGHSFSSLGASFPKKPIIATIALSSVSSNSGGFFSSFRSTAAECGVISDRTPREWGFPNYDPETGQVAQLTTGSVQFWLRSTNATVAAVAGIYDDSVAVFERLPKVVDVPSGIGEGLTPQAGSAASASGGLGQPLAVKHFEIVNRRGQRVGYHQEVQFEGGAEIGVDETIRRLESRKLPGVNGPLRGRVVEGHLG